MDLAAPPTLRTVTFLFTDVEASTRLWEQQTEAMRANLARHDALLHQTIETQGGHVFKTIGDAFCAVFPTTQMAVQAAITAQGQLGREIPQLRVRMAVHAGEAEERGGDYFGPVLNRVARLLIAGHGGQILLSQAAVEHLRDSLPPETHLLWMGEHRLRDLSDKERIYQLLLPGLPSRFPPLNTLDVAFRRGLIRTAAVAAVIVAMMAVLALTADTNARRAVAQQRRAERRELEVRHNLYAADMNLAQQAYDDSAPARMKRLLEQHRPDPGQQDLRGFEWRYLWRLSQGGQPLTLRGHTGAIIRVAISPDGRLLATASADRTVRLWDLPTQRTIATLRGHRAPVTAVAFSPDGKMLVTGSAHPDNTAKLWDLAAQRVIATFRTGTIEDFAVSPNGSVLATVGADPTRLKLWSLTTGRPAVVLERHKNGRIPAVAFSPNGRTIATGSSDGAARLWDVAARRAIATLGAFDGPIDALAFSPDGRILAVGTWRGAVELWNIASRREVVPPLIANAYNVRSIAFSPDGKTLVTAGLDSSVRLWNTTTWRYMLEFKGHKGGTYSVAFSPDGNTLATAGADQTVKLWRTATLAEADALKPNRRHQNMAEDQDSGTGYVEGRTLPTEVEKAIAGERPALIWVANRIIQQAIEHGASEVRVGSRPKRNGMVVNLVIKGVTHEMMVPPWKLHPLLIARYKEMADLEVNEHNKPQLGHITVSREGTDYDLDVHSEPNPDGEQIWFTIRARE